MTGIANDTTNPIASTSTPCAIPNLPTLRCAAIWPRAASVACAISSASQPTWRCAVSRGSFAAALLDVLTRGAKDVLHAAVAFVARVFVQHAIDRHERDLAGPRRGPRGRVLDREAIQQDAGRHEREALRDLQVLVGGRHATELLAGK